MPLLRDPKRDKFRMAAGGYAEVESSGFFNNSVVSHDAFCKLSCKRACDILLKIDT